MNDHVTQIFSAFGLEKKKTRPSRGSKKKKHSNRKYAGGEYRYCTHRLYQTSLWGLGMRPRVWDRSGNQCPRLRDCSDSYWWHLTVKFESSWTRSRLHLSHVGFQRVSRRTLTWSFWRVVRASRTLVKIIIPCCTPSNFGYIPLSLAISSPA
jgi:hypothetical protein